MPLTDCVPFELHCYIYTCSVQGSKTCFLDTMSLHTCVAGLTAQQKLKWLQHKNSSPNFKSAWMKVGAPSALEHVYKHHCNADSLDKTVRDVFVKGTVDDIRNDFQVRVLYVRMSLVIKRPYIFIYITCDGSCAAYVVCNLK